MNDKHLRHDPDSAAGADTVPEATTKSAKKSSIDGFLPATHHPHYPHHGAHPKHQSHDPAVAPVAAAPAHAVSSPTSSPSGTADPKPTSINDIADPGTPKPSQVFTPTVQPPAEPVKPEDESSALLAQLGQDDQDEDNEPVVKRPERGQGTRDMMSILGVLLSALVLAFGLIFFVFQSYQVDGPSMRTTLENQDHLIVWKLNKTVANVTGRQYVPNRGDVIIFNEPPYAEPGGTAGKQLIKRVIGLPGERVVYRGTDVIIYNEQYPNGYHPDKELGYGKDLLFQIPSNVDLTLDKDEIFVSGDNRDDSLDSRKFGPLKTDYIVGKLVVRLLPLNTFKLF